MFPGIFKCPFQTELSLPHWVLYHNLINPSLLGTGVWMYGQEGWCDSHPVTKSALSVGFAQAFPPFLGLDFLIYKKSSYRLVVVFNLCLTGASVSHWCLI